MASKPTVVFSIGAWLKPDTFDVIRAKLTERGIPSEAPAHPSIGAEPPNKTLADDVASLRSVLTRLIEKEGKDIVLVGHSYGGVVASSAAEGFAKADRKAAGQEGGVALVVYMAAFALDKGQSLLDMLGGQYLPWMEVEGDYVRCNAGAEAAFHDLAPEEQLEQQSGLVHTSRAVFSGASTFEPWHQIPSAYILCEEDRALPIQFQEMLSAKLGTELLYRVKSSHSPFLSMPDRLAEVLEELVSKAQ
ncbi:Alpha/beta hydrolase fold-1 [Aspergillus pseudodeflectus]|uniref:Alpha/beta hydrolase fold-1 n=1 Tax=Aspergillus pseudodeflectus TaxID=176178 RepID=A0ABR4LB40_9EURO